jgi:hypothetical protein
MVPFSEEHRTERPASLYATTKRAEEAIAHAYNHIYGLSITGLRFFTVYGSWGRGRGDVESAQRAAAGLEAFRSEPLARDEGAGDNDTEARRQPRGKIGGASDDDTELQAPGKNRRFGEGEKKLRWHCGTHELGRRIGELLEQIVFLGIKIVFLHPQ